jgi:hypothetical protein
MPKPNLAAHRGSSGREQTGLATLQADPDWKEL